MRRGLGGEIARAPRRRPRRTRRCRPRSRCRRAAPRSCPPPGSADRRGAASRRAGPARRRPSGRRSCAPESVSKIGAERIDIAWESVPAACTASTCSRPPAAWTMPAACATGCTTPVSLLASMSETSGLPPVARRQRSRQRGKVDPPVGVDRNLLDRVRRKAPARAAPTDARSPRPAADRAAVSPAVRSPATSASMLASVPPEVKTTSRGSAPTSAATCSRACSIRRRAARPSACTEDGLPTTSSAAAWRGARLRPQRRGGIPVEIDALGHGL